MITLVAIFVVICCALVIFVRLSVNSLNSQLNDISYDVTRIKGVVSDIYTQQPYNSWFTDAYKGLNNKLDDINDHLTTEIACLATKNAEDIKRSKEGFRVGDVIEYGGEETLVLDRQTATLNIGEELTDYIIWNVTQGIQQVSASHLEHNAKFLRRANLNE